MTCHKLDIFELAFATSFHAQQKAAGSARQMMWPQQVARSPAVRQPFPYGPDLCAPSSLTYPPAWVTIDTIILQV